MEDGANSCSAVTTLLSKKLWVRFWTTSELADWTLAIKEVTEDHESTSNDIHVDSPGSSSKLSNKSPDAQRRSKAKGLNNKSNELIDLATHTLKKFCASPTENKVEDEFDIAGKKFANDLRFLGPQQWVIVEKTVSDAVYFRKLGKLNKYTLIQLSPDTCRNDLSSWARLLAVTCLCVR